MIVVNSHCLREKKRLFGPRFSVLRLLTHFCGLCRNPSMFYSVTVQLLNFQEGVCFVFFLFFLGQAVVQSVTLVNFRQTHLNN